MEHRLIMENWRKFVRECEKPDYDVLNENYWKELKSLGHGLGPVTIFKEVVREFKQGYWRDVLISLLIGAGLAGTTVATKDFFVPKSPKEQSALVNQLETAAKKDPEAQKALNFYKDKTGKK